MGNELCLTKEERKKRIMLARAKYFERNFMKEESRKIVFEDSEALNREMRDEHYEARNMEWLTPSTIIYSNQKLRESKYKDLKGVNRFLTLFDVFRSGF